LKRLCKTCLKYTLLVFIILSSALALYVHYKGSDFDPIKEIQKLKKENRRDDALDLARFSRNNQKGDTQKIRELEKDLKYTPYEKARSFTWNGAIKGEVYDKYSDLGAISADLCILGDIRDLGIQSWLYLRDDPDFDRLLMILSAAGIGLSSTTLANGAASLAKNIIKYLKRIPHMTNQGILKRFLSGKISRKESMKVWGLLKKTTGTYPGPPAVSQISVM